MSQRVTAIVVAVPLLFGLFLTLGFVGVPYVVYSPGVTVDVLGQTDGEEIIQVTGHPVYRDEGELRMTTVYVTQPGGSVNVYDAMTAWLDPTQAIYPYDSVYPAGETAEQADQESAVQMTSSQDAAIAAALRKLGYTLNPIVEVLSVLPDTPADGKLQVRDQLVKIGDTTITKSQDVADAVLGAEVGEPLHFVVRRQGKEVGVDISPTTIDGNVRVGITTGVGFDFPFQVTVGIDPEIGGPSAGLMFSLAIYDTLTPGSLTDGAALAGTGTITPGGKVGPIGGIQQKIVAADRIGAELFLVPAANCRDALGAPTGDIRLVKVTTMDDALSSIQAWDADHDAVLPSCAKDAA